LGLDWLTASFDAVISNFLLLFPCLLIISILRFYLPQASNLVNIIIWNIVLSLVWVFVSKHVLYFIGGDDYLIFLQNSLTIRFVIALLILGWVTMICHVWYSSQDQKKQVQRKTETLQLAKDAELFKLRQQLHPHFLFNSLNSINALIGYKPEEARKMVQQLSDFLRSTLKKEENEWVALPEEIQHLQLYLDIEKVRFGKRLFTNIEISDEASLMKTPSLLLQPLLENAIKFGLYDTTENVTIHIKAFVNDNNLFIQIQNPFDAATSTTHKGTGFGLTAVSRRLQLIFNRTDLLQTSTEGNIFTTTIIIPQNV
jgi:LytS/YehU family sensor histidine kinase